MTYDKLGWLVAAITLAVDQTSKYWVLDRLDWGVAGRMPVTGWFDLTLVWNRGISYGLFQQDGDLGRWLLVTVAVAAGIGCGIWLRKVENQLMAAGIGFMIGGATGNGLDRAIHGAVIDFISLHHANFYWYVFNLADAAIVAAVAVLLYDSIFNRPNPA